ncbi:MAG: hypothetical protein ACQEXV_22405 [Bacillota bacterium]
MSTVDNTNESNRVQSPGAEEPKDFSIESFRNVSQEVRAEGEKDFAIESFKQIQDSYPARSARHATKIPYQRAINKAHDYAKEIKAFIKSRKELFKVKPTVKEYHHIQLEVRHNNGRMETMDFFIDKDLTKKYDIEISFELFNKSKSYSELQRIGDMTGEELKELSNRGKEKTIESRTEPEQLDPAASEAANPTPEKKQDSKTDHERLDANESKEVDLKPVRPDRTQLFKDAAESQKSHLVESLNSMTKEVLHKYQVGKDNEWHVFSSDSKQGHKYTVFNTKNQEIKSFAPSALNDLADKMFMESKDIKLLSAEPFESPFDSLSGKMKTLSQVLQDHSVNLPQSVKSEHLLQTVDQWKITNDSKDGKFSERMDYKISGDNMVHSISFKPTELNKPERQHMIRQMDTNPQVLDQFFNSSKTPSPAPVLERSR